MGMKRLSHQARRRFVLLWVLIVFLIVDTATGHAGDKVTIGPVEEVLLLPWQVRLLARIDTGADTSSIDARKLKIESNMAQFMLREEYGGTEIKLPIVDWRPFSSSESHELRPVVEMEICLGPKRLRTQVSLNDRSRVSYPFLVGRKVLKEGRFIVDVNRTKRVPAACIQGKR